MLTKEKVISSQKDLPGSFSMDELIVKLMLLQKIETGLAQSKKGEVFSAAEAEEMVKQWIKTGPARRLSTYPPYENISVFNQV